MPLPAIHHYGHYSTPRALKQAEAGIQKYLKTLDAGSGPA